MPENHASATVMPIAPGLNLVIGVDADPDLVERVSAMLDRGATVDSILDDVQQLVEADDLVGLDRLMSGTGFTSNRRRTTSAELAAAILALLPTLSLERIMFVHDLARFEAARSLGAHRRSPIAPQASEVVS